MAIPRLRSSRRRKVASSLADAASLLIGRRRARAKFLHRLPAAVFRTRDLFAKVPSDGANRGGRDPMLRSRVAGCRDGST
eukprot:10822862-Heterocapsa_arctica.AAC.1